MSFHKNKKIRKEAKEGAKENNEEKWYGQMKKKRKEAM